MRFGFWAFSIAMLFIACSSDSSTKQQTGVTSTGNAGDIAGYVVVQSNVSRTALPVDSALIVVYDSNGILADSVRSNRDGAFWFKGLKTGAWKVRATLANQQAEMLLTVKSNANLVSRLFLDGESMLLSDTLPVSLYSSQPGRVYQPFFGKFRYDPSLATMSIFRTWDEDTLVSANWSVAWGDLEMMLSNAAQSACNPKPTFISLSPHVLEGNRWIYNGNLMEDFDGETACSEALQGLSEMSGLNYTGLELLFQKTGELRGYFFAHDWCLTKEERVIGLYREALPDGASMSEENCNTIVVTDSNGVRSKHRILWLDIAAEWSEEEITDIKGKCIYKGRIGPEFSSGCVVKDTAFE